MKHEGNGRNQKKNEDAGKEMSEPSKNAMAYQFIIPNSISFPCVVSDPTKNQGPENKIDDRCQCKHPNEKKKGGKTEDLFDPENLAKYKAELEEKRSIAAEASPGGLLDRLHSFVCLSFDLFGIFK